MQILPGVSMHGAPPSLPPFRKGLKMTDPLPTGATIGILGGGQLGRMLAVAAARLGLRTHIYEPGTNPPAGDVAHALTTAAYEDVAALTAFAQSVDLVTYEFENIPTGALDIIEAIRPIHPNRRALATSQDRLAEKTFLKGIGLRVAAFADVTDAASLAAAITATGTPAILKTRRFGYDGKGQSRLMSPDDASAALADMAGAPAVLERFVSFTSEISVIAARNSQGAVACYDPGENVHRDGILHTTTVPASLSASLRTDAVLLAARILNALEYVGVMGVELFVTPQGLIVNEIAPRVHNSGHWTQNGCAVDQFEQHIRAIAGWPLGDGRRHCDVTMENLIGADVDKIPALAKEANCAIHLYGKTEAKAGRKMGHVNRIT
jgi:5-(carboxyamino)imidazole ribonucleotide synthase